MNVETVATQQITIALPKGVTVKARQWTGIGDIPDSLRMEVLCSHPDPSVAKQRVAEATDRILHHAEVNP